jgi:hypothetical protein
MPLKDIVADQHAWARNQWAGQLGARAPSLEENLIRPLSAETRADFQAGSGGELGRRGKPGKMSSLRSSSALSYNFFDPWRGADLQPLAKALGAKIRGNTLSFEQQYRHRLGSIPPNIDVVLDGDQVQPLGIECKFTEPYGAKKSHAPLDAKYFSGGKERWRACGLPLCQALAGAVGHALNYRRLSAGQLLKHLLGLAYTTRHSPRLWYIWFDSGCEEAAEHRIEVQDFADRIDDGVTFVAMTHQTLFVRIKPDMAPIPNYHSYLSKRYFAA